MDVVSLRPAEVGAGPRSFASDRNGPARSPRGSWADGGIALVCLLQCEQHLEGGTAYRQVRPTNTYRTHNSA